MVKPSTNLWYIICDSLCALSFMVFSDNIILYFQIETYTYKEL